MYFEFDNLSQALIGLSKDLKTKGTWTRRGTNPAGNMCLEFPEAVLIKINNPLNRYVFVPERKWNKTLGWIESLWIARGDNSLEMPSAYVKNLLSFSDDGETMRAGYGPRIRNYGAHFVTSFYKNDESYKMYSQYDSRCMSAVKTTDQLKFIVDKFKQDITTREAVITIHDPIADDFNNGEILITKDTPCTRSIHFMIVDGKMNCYVDMRSNDCFTYETKIPLLNGEVWEIGRLAEEKANEQFGVYSRNEKGEIVAGLAHHPRKMRKVSEIMEVKLDNGEIIRCTPDHRFMLKDGTYQKIQDIPIGTSLASLLGNHKIVSKRIIKEEVDVYDITVEKYHNFALESGVFVHNCFWGFSAVNVFNFTLMQEYVAAMVGVPVGVYFHKVDNLHIYEGSLPMLQSIIAANKTSRSVNAWSDWCRFPECSDWHGYKHTFTTLEEFDMLISLLSVFERGVRGADDLPYSNKEAISEIESKFSDEPMFKDWAKVIYRKWSKDTSVTFDNPYLTKLFI